MVVEMSVLNKLLIYFGTQVEMAERLDVSQGAVSQWITAGGLPAKRAIQIEIMTKGEFKAIDIVVPSEKDDI